MDSLEKARKKIAQDKARLENNERLLKLKEGKFRISRLIRIGELVEKAKLDKVDHNILMGAFISVSEQLSNQKVSTQWQAAGKEFLTSSKKSTTDLGTPLEISFESPPPLEIKKSLRLNKFRWNNIRYIWEGRGHKELITKLVNPHKGIVKEI